MGRRSHHSINKRQREVRQREKAQQKRERRGERKQSPDGNDIVDQAQTIGSESLSPAPPESTTDAELQRQ